MPCWSRNQCLCGGTRRLLRLRRPLRDGGNHVGVETRCSGCPTALLAATAARADDATTMIVVGSAQAEPGRTLTVDRGPHRVVTMRSEYWLGCSPSRPSPALQAQLKLPKDQGLVVEDLQPESPAAKAGVKQYDILLKGNGKPLTSLRDLLHLIDQVKDGKLTLELLRGGKHETVTVTPAKRPAQSRARWASCGFPHGRSCLGSRNFGPNVLEGGPLEFRVIRPGQILPPGGPVTGLPGGGLTTMEIIGPCQGQAGRWLEGRDHSPRHGAGQGRGDARQGQVGRHVRRLEQDPGKDPPGSRKVAAPGLRSPSRPGHDGRAGGRTGDGLRRHKGRPGTPVMPPLPGGGNVTFFRGGPLAVSPEVEKRLSEMQKQLDELRRSVDALQGKAQKAAPKPEN